MSIVQKETQEYYRAKEAAALLRVGLSTWWRWVQEGKIPAGTKLGPRVTVWRRSDVLALIDGGAA